MIRDGRETNYVFSECIYIGESNTFSFFELNVKLTLYKCENGDDHTETKSETNTGNLC